jgi:hypothetical protein
MVQILPEVPSFGQQFARQLGGGLSQGVSAGLQHAMAIQQAQAKESAKLKRDLSFAVAAGMIPKEMADQLMGKASGQEKAENLLIPNGSKKSQETSQQIEGMNNHEPKSLEAEEQRERAIGALKPEWGKQLTHQREIREKHTSEMRKETLDARKEYSTKAKAAKRSIENKKQMLALLKKGKIDDPLTVEVARYLPGAIAGKILSPDTQVYKTGLFNEFEVLKTMFPGQIRVKEIELLEDKLASLEKSHEAKARILENGIKKLEYDRILADAAREVEKKHPNASVLEFDGLVEQLAEPEVEKLFEDILADYDKIYLDFAPSKSSYIDQNGDTYTNVPKSKLKDLFDSAKQEGLDLRVLK